MTLPLVWLGDVLREAGLTVVETPGWRERGADSGEQPQPVGVLEHHTTTPSSPDDPAPSVQMCVDGRPGLEGPLCHGLIGFDGTVHLIAAGRANHAGEAKMSGPNPGGDGNVLYVGFEWDYQGVDQGPSAEQYSAAVRASEAVLHHMDRPADAARGHRETSVTGKPDPGHVDLERFRSDIAKIIMGERRPPGSGGPSMAPVAPPSPPAAQPSPQAPPARPQGAQPQPQSGQPLGGQSPGSQPQPPAANQAPPQMPAAPHQADSGSDGPERDILRRIENELLGPLDQQGALQGWQTELGPRSVVGMLVDLVNGLLAQPASGAGQQPPPPQQAGGQPAAGRPPGGTPQAGGVRPDPESIKAAFSALPPEQAAPLLAQLVQIQQSRQLTPQQQAQAHQAHQAQMQQGHVQQGRN